MLIPENILQTLLCSVCERYLSITPIKVYPNRHIKCGRCSKEDDHGVVSTFYELLVKDFEFPCINRFEGCEHILSYEQVKKHEENCISSDDDFDCPFCNDFKQNAYYLLLHLKQYHFSNLLLYPEFTVEFDKGNVQNTFWYCKENLFLILFCSYDSLENKLFLDVSLVGKKNRKNVMQNFVVNTIENKTKLKSSNYPCSPFSSISYRGFDIDPNMFPKQVAFCKFEIQGLVLKMPTGPIESELSSASLSTCHLNSVSAVWVFKDISKYDKDKLVEGSALSHKGLNWKICIKKKIHSNGQRGFYVFLTYLNKNNELVRLKINCTLLLIEKSDARKTEVSSTLNEISEIYLTHYIWDDMAWSRLQQDDSIKLNVEVTFEFKEKLCTKCNIQMCEDCRKSPTCENKRINK